MSLLFSFDHHIPNLFLAFLLQTLNKQMFAGLDDVVLEISYELKIIVTQHGLECEQLTCNAII